MPVVGPVGEGAVFIADSGNGAKGAKPKAVLIIASFSDAFGPQFKQQLMQGLESGSYQQKPSDNDDLNEELKNTKDSTVERTIRRERPQKSPLFRRYGREIGQAKDKSKMAAFQGKTGPALLLIMADEATLSAKQVNEIIQSIDKGAKDEKKDDNVKKDDK